MPIVYNFQKGGGYSLQNEQTTSKKKKGASKILGFAAYILVCALFGVALGILLDKSGQSDLPFGQYLVSLLINLLLMYLSIFLQFIIHEGGHLLFGLMSGYSFILFRIGSLTLVKTADGLKFKRISLAGTGGQCLMSPPEWNDGNFPYKLYNLGGFLMNLISAVIFFVVFLLDRHTAYLPFFSLCMAALGLAIGLMNGIPMRIGGVDNDGYNVLSLGKDKAARWAFWMQLRASAELALGKGLADMPEEWFDMPGEGWQDNALTASIPVFRENRFMETQEFDKAKELVDMLLDEPNQLAQLYKNMLLCDRMYLELIGECDHAKLDSWNTKEHKQFRLAMKNYLTIMRTEYAWALLKEKDSAKAEKILQAFEKRGPSHPNPGEVESERRLILTAKEKAAQPEA